MMDRIDPEDVRPGHPRSETTKVVQTFRHFVHEGVGWRTLRASNQFVSGSTLRRWMGRWFAKGTLRAVHRALVLALRSGPTVAVEAVGLVVDSCSVRAKHGGDLVGPNPTDRGKPGTKYHVVTLTEGTPLGAVASAANVNDTMMFPHLLKLAQAVCRSIGKIFADAGYDSAFNRDLCRKQGVAPVIPRHPAAHPAARRRPRLRSRHSQAHRRECTLRGAVQQETRAKARSIDPGRTIVAQFC